MLPRVPGRENYRLVIVPVSINLADLYFEVCSLPEVEGVDGGFIFEFWLHCCHNFIKDFLAKLIEEDSSFISLDVLDLPQHRC